MFRKVLLIVGALTGLAAIVRWWRGRDRSGMADVNMSAGDLLQTGRDIQRDMASRLDAVRAEVDKLRAGGGMVADMRDQVRSAQDALNDLMSASAERRDELKARAERVVAGLEQRVASVRKERPDEPPKD